MNMLRIVDEVNSRFKNFIDQPTVKIFFMNERDRRNWVSISSGFLFKKVSVERELLDYKRIYKNRQNSNIH